MDCEVEVVDLVEGVEEYEQTIDWKNIRMRDPSGWAQLRDPEYHKAVELERKAEERRSGAVKVNQGGEVEGGDDVELWEEVEGGEVESGDDVELWVEGERGGEVAHEIEVSPADSDVGQVGSTTSDAPLGGGTSESDYEVRFVCKECKKRFYVEQRYSAHKCAKKEATHVCEECGQACVSLKGLSVHRKSKHGNHEVYKCDQCDFQTKRPTYLKQHKAARHENNFVCDVCDKTFGLESHLSMHHHKSLACRKKRAAQLLESYSLEFTP